MSPTSPAPTDDAPLIVAPLIVDPDDVRGQTERIAGSAVFRSSRRLSATLRVIVDETLAGHARPLRERAIATQALERSTSFDPRVDPVVRVQVSRLRAALDRYYEEAGATDPIRIFVPKGGYRAVFVRLPDRRRGASAREAGVGPKLVVHHFEDLGVPASAPHLATSLADAVVTELSRFSGCRPVGPVPFGSPMPRDVGEQDFVLRGSIRSSPDTLRVTVRLSPARSDTTCWSLSWDLPLDGRTALAVEDAVAARSAAALADFRGAIHRYGPLLSTVDAASAAVARFVTWYDDLDPSTSSGVVDALEHALGLEPWNAALLAMLAETERLRSLTVGGPPPERSDRLARRALSLDPEDALATMVLAACDVDRGDHRNARASIDAALLRSPHHPSLLVTAGSLHAQLGDWSNGVHLVRDGMSRNASHAGWHRFWPAIDAWYRGDHEEALGQARHIDTPGWLLGPLARALALAGLGRLEPARNELAVVCTDVVGWDERRHEVLARLGVPAELARRACSSLDALA